METWKPVNGFEEPDIQYIYKLRSAGLLQKDIAKLLGITRATVAGILTGKQWPHLHRFKA